MNYTPCEKLCMFLFLEMADMESDMRREECITKFHSVYMSEKSYECAELAAGSAIGK